jgi:hypothetical protein
MVLENRNFIMLFGVLMSQNVKSTKDLMVIGNNTPRKTFSMALIAQPFSLIRKSLASKVIDSRICVKARANVTIASGGNSLVS